MNEFMELETNTIIKRIILIETVYTQYTYKAGYNL